MLAALAVATAACWAQPVMAQTATAPSATLRPSPGDCLWNTLPEADRTEVLTAYGRDMNSATKALAAHDKAIQAAAAACVGRAGAPRLFIQFATTSAMIRAASAQRLAPAGLTSDGLRTLWNDADPAARACFRVNAARVYGPMAEKLLNGETCPDQKAAQTVLTSARLDLAKDTAQAAQALIHFNAIAQGEQADALLAAFVRYGPAPAGS
ncbi:hypothetical protein AS593_12635 [Caulobacter vibrioides]|nr:hypothetical protein AS593_12635 [Caulobacter vibrioides]